MDDENMLIETATAAHVSRFREENGEDLLDLFEGRSRPSPGSLDEIDRGLQHFVNQSFDFLVSHREVYGQIFL
jgi:hypothetical protein